MKTNRLSRLTVLAVLLALALFCAAPAARRSAALAGPPISLVQDEEEPAPDISKTDVRGNILLPVILIVAGAAYLGFVRLRTHHRR